MSEVKASPTVGDFEEFLQGYLVCMLWSSTDNSNDSGGDPLDDNYGVEDVAESALKDARETCKDFVDGNIDDLRTATETDGYTWARAGHDFWLTRNRHGAGFWDRGLGEQGDRLSCASKVYSGCDPYVGDDGKIYTQ